MPRADAPPTSRLADKHEPNAALTATAATTPSDTHPAGAMSTTSPSSTRQGIASLPGSLPQHHARRPPTTKASAAASSAPRAAFARITPAHLARLGGGDLLARTERVEWSKLLRRTFAADVLTCPRCSGRARIIGAVQDPADARSFLDALRERSIPTHFNTRTGDDDAEPVIDLDNVDTGPRPGPARTTDTERDAPR